MPIEYAHALHQVVKRTSDHTVVVHAFIAILKRSGKLKALPAIVRAYTRILEKEASHTPVLIVAKEDATTTAVAQLQKIIGTSVTQPKVIYNENIIGGWKYSDENTLVDASHILALTHLYKRITA